MPLQTLVGDITDITVAIVAADTVREGESLQQNREQQRCFVMRHFHLRTTVSWHMFTTCVVVNVIFIINPPPPPRRSLEAESHTATAAGFRCTTTAAAAAAAAVRCTIRSDDGHEIT